MRRGMAIFRLLVVFTLVVGLSSTLSIGGTDAQSDPTATETPVTISDDSQLDDELVEVVNDLDVTNGDTDQDENGGNATAPETETPPEEPVDERGDEETPPPAEPTEQTPPVDGNSTAPPDEGNATATEPSQPAEPAEPTESVEPAQPTEPTEEPPATVTEGATEEPQPSPTVTPSEAAGQAGAAEVEAAAVGLITILKLNCDAEIDISALNVAAIVANPLGFDGTDIGCTLGSGVNFTAVDPLTGLTVGSATTANGVAQIAAATTGANVRLTETVPAGFTPQGPPSRTFRLLAANTQVFVNVRATLPVPVTALVLIKLNCDTEIEIESGLVEAILNGTALDDLAALGCELASGVGFTVTNPLTGSTLGVGTTLNGIATIAGLPVGSEILIDEATQVGYTPQTAEPREITLTEGAVELFVNVASDTTDGSVTVTTTNEAGDELTGACYQVLSTAGTVVGSACDDDDGLDDGVIVIDGLPVGDFTLVQTTPPPGYEPAEAISIAITNANPDIEVTVVNGEGAGSVTVATEDGDGDLLTGACYEVQTAGGTVVGSACDGDDGANDGVTVVEQLPPGSYTLVQTTPPPGYVAAPDQPITIATDDLDITATVTNDAGDRTLIVQTQDPEGNPLLGACYRLEDDGGNEVDTACDADDGNDGETTFTDLTPGSYTVVQTTAPGGYQLADEQPVEVDPDDAETVVTVTNGAGAGTVTIDTTDDDDAPLTGACYEARTSDGTVVGSACDIDDGTDDGTTTIENLPPGTYDIVQVTPPDGYDPAPTGEATLTPDDPNDEITVVNDDGAGSVVVTTEDAEGNPLEGACYEVRDSGDNVVGSACDEDDGLDGVTTIGDLEPGDYTLVQTTPPPGFDTEPNSDFAIDAEDPITPVTVVNDDPAGSITVTTIDGDGDPLTGACYNVRDENDAIVGSACDIDDGTDDGTTVIDNLPIGDYTLEQATPPTGFDPAADVPFSVTPTVPDVFQTVVNGDAPGSITVSSEDANGDALAGACYRVVTSGGSTIASGCDDGSGITFENLPFGTYTVEQTTPPPGFLAADDETAVLTDADPTEDVTFTNDEAVGTVTITTQNSDDEALSGACYRVLDAGGETVGEACDAADGTDDGSTTIDNLPPGTYTLVQITPPAGYDAEPNGPFTITVEEPNETVTVVNDDGNGVVTILTEDSTGGVLLNACYEVRNAENELVGSACDSDDAQPDDGTTTIGDLEPGTYTVIQTTAPGGFDTEPNQTATIEAPTFADTVTFVNNDPAGSITIRTEDSDDQPIAGACYEVRTAGGALIGEFCDAADGDNDGEIVIDDLPIGEYVLEQTTTPDGYEPAADVNVSITPEDINAEVDVTVEPIPGTITIDTVDASGDPLTGACYEARTSDDTVVGEACDDDDGANDGTTTIDDLPPDAYTVVQVTPPAGYTAAPNRSVTLTIENRDREITVVNGEAAGSVTIITRDDDDEPIAGACYEVRTQDGSVVGSACDEDDGENDGETTVDNLPPGTYDVVQTTPPPVYDPADDVEVEITPNDPNPVIDVTNDEGNGEIVVTTVDNDGGPLTGACYQVRDDDGEIVGSACDGDDNDLDGQTTIGNLPPGDYTLEQTTTPAGYAPADDVEVSITPSDPSAEVTVTNGELGSGTAIISFEDEDGDPVRGVCARIEFMTDANAVMAAAVGEEICDGDDGAVDGQITFNGLGVGEYEIVVTDVPDGYVVPDNVAFSIDESGESVSITVTVQFEDDDDGNGNGNGNGTDNDNDGETPTNLPNTGVGFETIGRDGSDGTYGANWFLMLMLALGGLFAAGLGVQTRRRSTGL